MISDFESGGEGESRGESNSDIDIDTVRQSRLIPKSNFSLGSFSQTDFPILYRNWCIISYITIQIGVGIFVAAPGPILSILQLQCDASLDNISFIFAAMCSGYALASVASGYILNESKLHRYTSIAMIIGVVAMVAMPYVTQLYLLNILFFIAGVMNGLIDTNTHVCTLALFRDSKESCDPYMQALHFAFGIGSMLSPLIIEFSIQMDNGRYQMGFGVICLFYIVGAILFAFLKTPISIPISKQSQTENNTNSNIDTSLKGGETNTNEVTTYDTFDTDNQSNTVQWSVIWFIVIGSAFLGFHVGFQVSYGAYLTIFAVDYLSQSHSIGVYMTALYWGFLAIGRLTAICVGSHFKPKTMLWISLIGLLISSIIFIAFPTVTIVTWICSAAFGFFEAPLFGAIFVFAEECVTVGGQKAGWMIFGASLGGFFIPPLIGNLISFFGDFYCAASMFAICCVQIMLFSVMNMFTKTKS